MIQISQTASNSGLKPILIAGCSVRAAVWSARSVQIACIAADQFGDVDLRASGVAWLPLSSDYHELPEYVQQLDLSGWCYTGGLENHPELLRQCERSAPLFGVRSYSVERLRDPILLSRVVEPTGIHVPETRLMTGKAPDGDWLLKPWRSGGGQRIRQADRAGAQTGTGGESFYLQRRVRGVPYSVSFLARNGKGEILGAVRQFIATSSEIQVSRGIRLQFPFLFCGGVTCEVGEVASPDVLQDLVDRLVQEFELVGLCGIDLIKTDTSRTCLLEVNPRYTATMELLERRSGTRFLPQHFAACQGKEATIPAFSATKDSVRPMYVAKQVLYTPTGLTIGEEGLVSLLGGSFLQASDAEIILADQPAPGSVLQAGWPICSLISLGRTEEQCLRTLRYYAGRLAIVLDQEKWSEYHRDL
ncbi:ATP-grasp domain protein [Polystyrenella longa]|uniref:ATP-grasp domain protein n=1 Tax=Polystyrenella longa TaxID=2528007 RepID=A0A518CK54_9PLAN|nr:ATP-grasp domain-containing protein [Polystyrenella longa]QDU79601.1 ATP-grasp domain protein [Polystyrenella longa]